MKRNHLLWIDIVAATTLLGMMLVVDGECYRRGVDLGTLTLGAAALAFFFSLGKPWKLLPTWRRGSISAYVLASISLLAGLVSDLLLPIAIAWSALLWAWLSGRLPDKARQRVFRLLLLTLFVFPWVDLDAKPVNWTMRIASAIASQQALDRMGLPTTREGTVLHLVGQPVEINEQCGDGQTLHAMLIVGLAAAHVYPGSRQPIWPWMPVLCLFAWLGNILRVMLICLAVAYSLGEPYFGWLHDGGGWLVVALMMGLCIAGFATWNRLRQAFRSMEHRPSQVWWPWKGRLRPEGMSASVALWGLPLVCVTLGCLWRMIPLPDAQLRLQHLSVPDGDHPSRDLELTESEMRLLGEARCVKRVYRFGRREFLVTAIDGSGNRRAVHDPMYCWTIIDSSQQPLRGGNGTALRVVDQGIEKDVLFWFSNGATKHASPTRYLLQTSLRRATLGWLGEEPVLLLVEPLEPAPVNWYRVLDEFPWLMDL